MRRPAVLYGRDDWSAAFPLEIFIRPRTARRVMSGIEGEQVLLRVFLSESRTLDHKPLHRHILELLRREGLAGATVLTGLAGFGHDRRVHTTSIEVMAEGLPIVVEAVDTPEQ